MTIDTSQNVGIGNTPSGTSATGYRSLELGTTAGTGITAGNGDFYVPVNAYVAGGAWKYAVTGQTASLFNASGSVYTWSQAASGTAGNNISFSERMRIDSSGNVGIGVTSVGARLDISAAVGTMRITSSTGTNGVNLRVNNTGGDFYFGRENSTGGAFGVTAYSSLLWSEGAYPMVFATNNAERMRITSGGNFLVGTTADISTGGTSVARACFDSGSTQNGMKVKLNNTSYAAYISTTTGSDHYFGYMNNSAGTNVGYILCTNTTTTYNTGSDYRLKENIAPMTGALAKVQQLKPCTYTWKADGSTGEGFIAHELQEIVPVCVNGEKDAVDKNGKPIYQGVDYSKLVTTLTAAIQELNAKVEAQAAEIQALKGAR
jgi:hypothetical protein